MASAGEGLEIGHVLLDFVLVILAAKVGGELFERMRQPAVLGELLAGLVVGPTVFGIIPNVFDLDPGATITAASSEAVILFIAELGAIILLFEVGLESNLKDLVRVGRAATYVAIIGIVASVGLGYGSSWAFAQLGYWPDNPLYHLFVGATFAATSVGITARVLKDMGRLATAEARIILGAAVLDDVGALLVLAIVTGLVSAAAAGTGFDALALGKTAAIGIGFLVVSLLIGIKFVPPLFARLAKMRVRGTVMAFAFLFAFLMAWLAHEAGLATIVGAFAAGLILAQAKEHHEIFNGVRPFADLFVPFFFVVLGAAVNLREVGDDVTRVVVVTAALVLIATFAKLLCGLGVKKGEASRMVVGVGMVPRGEVGLIFVVFGIQKLAIEQWEAVTLILVVMLTTVVTPVWLRSLYKGKPLPGAGKPPGEHRDEIGDRTPGH